MCFVVCVDTRFVLKTCWKSVNSIINQIIYIVVVLFEKEISIVLELFPNVRGTFGQDSKLCLSLLGAPRRCDRSAQLIESDSTQVYNINIRCNFFTRNTFFETSKKKITIYRVKVDFFFFVIFVFIVLSKIECLINGGDWGELDRRGTWTLRRCPKTDNFSLKKKKKSHS